jgi:hypothetical protein
MHIDLSTIPPLITPSPPSNTLLITNLQDPAIFHPEHLQTIRELINDSATLHAFSPLKSFRRIIVSFYNTEDAVRIRQTLDGENIMGDRVRVYFGEPTPVNPIDQHLAAPKSQKLFFISPPPSPPHGWMMRNEEPPNKEVHADDLAAALAKIHAKPGPRGDVLEETEKEIGTKEREGKRVQNRTRSGSSTVVYHPEDHGDSPNLPAVMVEDLTERDVDELGNGEVKIMAHTARPPVELM